MLTSFWLTLRNVRRDWLSRPRHDASSIACSECEYCFYNHQATLPFDQIDECLRARRDALTQHHTITAERYYANSAKSN
ncbi:MULTISPECIES: hypothetical protein [Dickeya]|uniref:Uncharacterized protein n=1 Tax=Dickeya aquatica TaxID=1401087 RepID=A0A375ADI4_9GAMM|nr:MULTISPECIES: hypothetical protein [Dickeya]SLM63659.1 hypothetical protein DAQ1742_02806 [Dickeya aquatica]